MADEIIKNKEVVTETPVVVQTETSTEAPIVSQEESLIVEPAPVVPQTEQPIASLLIKTPVQVPVVPEVEATAVPKIIVETEPVVSQTEPPIIPTAEISVELPKAPQVIPQTKLPQTAKQNTKLINNREQKQSSSFLCNSLSDSFLKNIKNFKEIRKMGREIILLRKQKRLDKIMILFLNKKQITLSDVEKFLRVTEKTATRYIVELKKQNKIKKKGKDDRGAFLYMKL